ncbi:MAG: VWA domain-containing protein, partial [Lachnospiraceae bacterium]|nr:VWA domain-containing protein [Lachnospiraceae bacterium]
SASEMAYCTDEYRDPYYDPYVYPKEGETYQHMDENEFTDVARQPLSTFAADVDTASYSNLRRMITDGYAAWEIPEDAVRIEEMINYFQYDIPAPNNGDRFAVTAEMNTCPWNKDHKLMMVGMRTQQIDLSEAPASNLVFLIDVSGSMYDEDKLPLLQKSFCMLAENLTERDRISIVTYAGSDEIVLEGVKGNEYRRISNAINSLEAEGSTNGGEGIKTAYRLAEKYFIKGGNNRVLLATDGDLNVGITTQSGLEELIGQKKESGVYLSVLGFGEGNINDANMELLADKGNGNYAYIDSAFEANRVLVSQLGSTLFTVAKDVKLQVEFNPENVAGYRLIGYENRTMAAEDFNDDTKDGGEIGAGHCVAALYEILPAGKESRLRYAGENAQKTETKFADEYCAVSIRYKEPDGDRSKLLTYPVKTKVDTDCSSDDLRFASCVAQVGMILKNSPHRGDSDLAEVAKELDRMQLTDESKKEFAYLVKQLASRG